MNQIMVNAVELDLLLKQIDDLKVENTLLKKQLADAHDRTRVLKEDVGFAKWSREREYTKVGNL